MNKDNFEKHWNEIKNKVQQKWTKLTNEDITHINGKSDLLIKALERRYGYEKDRAQKEFNSWHCESSRGSSNDSTSRNGLSEFEHNQNKLNQEGSCSKNSPSNKNSNAHQHDQEKKRKAG
jgi:uncharacterized protein YjbJ (UPF0337 family)